MHQRQSPKVLEIGWEECLLWADHIRTKCRSEEMEMEETERIVNVTYMRPSLVVPGI